HGGLRTDRYWRTCQAIVCPLRLGKYCISVGRTRIPTPAQCVAPTRYSRKAAHRRGTGCPCAFRCRKAIVRIPRASPQGSFSARPLLVVARCPRCIGNERSCLPFASV